MQYIPVVLRSALIIALFWGILAGVTKSAEFSLTDQTLQAIEDCISRTPSQWPDEWKQEYIETIRKAIELQQVRENARKELPKVGRELAPLLTTTRQEAIFLIMGYID